MLLSCTSFCPPLHISLFPSCSILLYYSLHFPFEQMRGKAQSEPGCRYPLVYLKKVTRGGKTGLGMRERWKDRGAEREREDNQKEEVSGLT